MRLGPYNYYTSVLVVKPKLLYNWWRGLIAIVSLSVRHKKGRDYNPAL